VIGPTREGKMYLKLSERRHSPTGQRAEAPVRAACCAPCCELLPEAGHKAQHI